jgi:hypothetical protein
MKRFLIVIFLLAAVAVSALSADRYTPGRSSAKDAYQGVVAVQGIPRSAPGIVYIDNTARTIQSLFERAGGTYLGGTADNALAPIGLLVVCESKDVRWAFGGVTPTTSLGVLVPAAASWVMSGPTWVSTGKAIAAGATDNVACPGFVLIY